MLGNIDPAEVSSSFTESDLEEFSEFHKANPGEFKENLRKFRNSKSDNKIVVTDVERMKLQTGETNNSMTNDQMVE